MISELVRLLRINYKKSKLDYKTADIIDQAIKDIIAHNNDGIIDFLGLISKVTCWN